MGFLKLYSLLIAFCVVMMLVFQVLLNQEHSSNMAKMCFKDLRKRLNISDGAKLLPEVLLADPKPSPTKLNIFFIESTCRQEKVMDPTTFNMIWLTKLQACAIESAALHNPNSEVFVLFATPTYTVPEKLPPRVQAILTYTNVHLRNVQLHDYTRNTPVYSWLRTGMLYKSRYLTLHASDFLRYLTLWRFGGLYLDTDVLVLRSLEGIPPNYVGAESDTIIANGVLNMAGTGIGNAIARSCLREFAYGYTPGHRSYNGPGVMTRVMRVACGVKNTSLMESCHGFKVYPRNEFYEIPCSEWHHFFVEKYTNDTLKRLQDKYITHLWNEISKVREIGVVRKNSKLAYDILAGRHCPKVYKHF